jgi:site-specific DNA-adenine methylase
MFFHLVSDKSMTLTAYLSDTNEELIKAYNVVKANDGELIEVLTERSKVVFL